MINPRHTAQVMYRHGHISEHRRAVKDTPLCREQARQCFGSVKPGPIRVSLIGNSYQAQVQLRDHYLSFTPDLIAVTCIPKDTRHQ